MSERYAGDLGSTIRLVLGFFVSVTLPLSVLPRCPCPGPAVPPVVEESLAEAASCRLGWAFS